MPEQNHPDVDTSPIMDAAVAMHELYSSYVAGGFTEAQALTIVVGVLTSQLGRGK